MAMFRSRSLVSGRLAPLQMDTKSDILLKITIINHIYCLVSFLLWILPLPSRRPPGGVVTMMTSSLKNALELGVALSGYSISSVSSLRNGRVM